MATPDHVERPPDPGPPHVRRGLRLRPPTVPARPDGHWDAHAPRQVGADGAVEGPEARLPAGLHYLGALSGEPRIAAPAPMGARLEGESSQRLGAARRHH